ncbi:MAG: AMP-binding protein [Clostridia bacterium]|nr:AMP-binding protein [Clostridia bacterium]
MKRIYPKQKFDKFASICDMLDFAAEQYGDKVQYRYFTKGTEIGEMTYRRFREDVDCVGTALAARGLRGATVAILAESRPQWMVAFCAVVCGGGMVVPMDKELQEDQIIEFLNRSESELIFCSDRYAQRLKERFGELATARFIINFDNVTTEDHVVEAYDELLEKGKLLLSDGYMEYTTARFDTSKACTLLFTSGTTGTSKGVLLSQDNLTACVFHSANMVNITKDDVLFSVLPMHHTYELVCAELGAICVGATTCFNNSLKYFLRNVKIFRPTAMIVVPLFLSTIYKKITEEIKKKNKEKLVKGAIAVTKTLRKVGIDLRETAFKEITAALGGRLKNVICGGAAMDPELVDRFAEFGITVVQGYGISECSPLVCVVPYTAIRNNSVGVPAYGTQVKIVITDEGGREFDAPVGEIGEICVKSPQVMIGYHNNPEATAEAFNNEGYFRTGDYGYMDKDGYLYITGRKKNIIILSNGKNVYPEEIEEFLYKLEIIKECVVVARSKGEEDDVITAVIYPDYEKFEGKTDEEIIATVKAEVASVNKKLPTFKQVRNIELRKNEFEKTTTRKIMRYKV